MVNVRFSRSDANLLQALFYHHMLAKNINIAVRGYTPLHLALTTADVVKYATAIAEFIETYRQALIA